MPTPHKLGDCCPLGASSVLPELPLKTLHGRVWGAQHINGLCRVEIKHAPQEMTLTSVSRKSPCTGLCRTDMLLHGRLSLSTRTGHVPAVVACQCSILLHD